MQLRISPKNSSNLRVELDGICRGTLPTRVLLPLFPTNFEGKITAEQASELLQIMRKQAFSILVDYLAKAEHSSQQCRNLLQRKEYHAQIIEEALERCRSLNYLDDSRFSEVLINSYVTRKASKRAIIAKLREQQISPISGNLYWRNFIPASRLPKTSATCYSNTALHTGVCPAPN